MGGGDHVTVTGHVRSISGVLGIKNKKWIRRSGDHLISPPVSRRTEKLDLCQNLMTVNGISSELLCFLESKRGHEKNKDVKSFGHKMEISENS